MDTRSEFRYVVLAPRDVFVLDTPNPVEIVARSGCVWLTQAGDSRDVVLRPGQSFAMPRAVDVVITSRGAAELVVAHAKRRASDSFRQGTPMRLVAALVAKALSRAVVRGAGRRLAARLHLGPPAQPGMD
ncbi:DUF2917 domain-containing protein [Aromatoleum sp.]|uniref:DUF2917 domain-containing protein n=1 Tax=Aromatoleum sp. TaxID=2307007 RepID=UPI002FCC55EB